MTSYSYPLVGRKVIYIGNTMIPSRLVSGEAATITVTPATTEIESQVGTYTIPNGGYEELSATLNVIIPSVRWLGKIFPGLYKTAAFKRASLMEDNGETGQVVFGATECAGIEPTQIVIHPECMGDDSSQDIQIPNALIAPGSEFTFGTDPTEIEITVSMIPGEDGAVIIGEGSLSAMTHYDPTVGEYVVTPQLGTLTVNAAARSGGQTITVTPTNADSGNTRRYQITDSNSVPDVQLNTDVTGSKWKDYPSNGQVSGAKDQIITVVEANNGKAVKAGTAKLPAPTA